MTHNPPPPTWRREKPEKEDQPSLPIQSNFLSFLIVVAILVIIKNKLNW